MGIYAKYNLTLHAHSKAKPVRTYDIDMYKVHIYDTEHDIESYHNFPEWEDVYNCMQKFFADDYYDNWNYSITGIVFD